MSLRRYAVTLASALCLTRCSEPVREAVSAPPPLSPDGKVRLTEAEWRARLTPLAFAVLRQKSTELAYTGRYDKHYRPGVYLCAGCNNTLFASTAKFDSRTGWPSFTEPLGPSSLSTRTGDRDEVLCRRCDGHLGHVFPDGPPPGGLRYCINSAALRFEPAE